MLNYTRVKSTRDKIIRDLRAVKSACPAYTSTYILPTTDKSNICLVSVCFRLSQGALHSGYPLYPQNAQIPSPYIMPSSALQPVFTATRPVHHTQRCIQSPSHVSFSKYVALKTSFQKHVDFFVNTIALRT